MSRLLVTGSVAYDLLLHYDGLFADSINPDQLVDLSVGFIASHFERHHGGTAANISWNLKLLNQDPMLISTVGNDGQEYLNLLEQRVIETDLIDQQMDSVTATAVIATDSEEHQISFYHPGADGIGEWPEISEENADDIGYAIVSPRNPRLMLQAARWCSEFAIPFLFDPGQAVMGFGKDDLLQAIQLSNGLIVNAYEWSLVSERAQITIDQALTMTEFLVITQAEQGLTIYTQDKSQIIFACPAEQVVNPTGAGDALRAGFLTGLSAGWTLEQCGQLGAAIASFVVEQHGTQLDYLDLNRVLGRAEATYGEVLPELP